jgi:hypothetical protein
MITVDWAIAALLEKGATVESVAKTIGVLEGQRSGDFSVRPVDSIFEKVVIGAQANSSSSGPKDVEFLINRDHRIVMKDMSATCDTWRKIPTNPSASPFLYACQSKRSTAEVKVNVLVTLSANIDSPSATITKILLQRNVR